GIELKSKLNFISQINTFRTQINSNIDLPVYYINLDRSPERNEHMQTQLQKFKVKEWKRIQGIEGPNDPSIIYTNDFKDMTPGEIGCSLSHLRAIKTAYDNGLESVLIMEDDASFEYVPFWNFTLSRYIQDLPSDWHILQLHSNYDYSKF